jgi:hypothetical protein
MDCQVSGAARRSCGHDEHGLEETRILMGLALATVILASLAIVLTGW